VIETLKETQETGATGCFPALSKWKRAEPPDYKGFGYCIDAVLVPDNEDGGYIASIAQLPGVHSQGDDAVSAIRNIVEAVRAVIESYHERGTAIPWNLAPRKTPNEDWFRIVV